MESRSSWISCRVRTRNALFQKDNCEANIIKQQKLKGSVSFKLAYSTLQKNQIFQELVSRNCFLLQVKCKLNETAKCMGDLCFIYPGYPTSTNRFYEFRGCVTNNETLFPNLFQVSSPFKHPDASYQPSFSGGQVQGLLRAFHSVWPRRL